VSKAQQSLADKYTQVFGSEVFGHASKRATTNSWAQILGKEAETGVEQDAAKKFVQSAELAPVETAARKGKYAEAIEEIDKKLEQYRPGRQQNYGQVEAASKFEVGKGLDELDTALFRSRNATKNPQATQALEKARQDWVQDFSSADSGAVQRALLRPEGVESTEVADQLRAITDHLPQSGRISRTQFADAVKETNAGPEAVRYLDQHILDPKAGLLSWDPKATIPALELRAQATARQQSALQAFDKLNPNLSVETKTAVKKAIVSGLEKHLDSAAATSPAAAQAVRRIRQDDVRFSVLLAAKQGLSEAVEKQQRSEFKPLTSLGKLLHTGVGLGVTAPIAYAQGKKASHELEQGNLPGALEHGAFALGAGALAGRALGQKLSILANRAQNSQAAQKLYQAIQARMSHGPIGVATSTTLGQQQAQQQPQAQPQQGAPQ
jgi:hypothetical protein